MILYTLSKIFGKWCRISSYEKCFVVKFPYEKSEYKMISLQTIFNNMIFKIEHIDLDIAQLALQNSFLDNNSKDEGK